MEPFEAADLFWGCEPFHSSFLNGFDEPCGVSCALDRIREDAVFFEPGELSGGRRRLFAEIERIGFVFRDLSAGRDRHFELKRIDEASFPESLFFEFFCEGFFPFLNGGGFGVLFEFEQIASGVVECFFGEDFGDSPGDLFVLTNQMSGAAEVVFFGLPEEIEEQEFLFPGASRVPRPTIWA